MLVLVWFYYFVVFPSHHPMKIAVAGEAGPGAGRCPAHGCRCWGCSCCSPCRRCGVPAAVTGTPGQRRPWLWCKSQMPIENEAWKLYSLQNQYLSSISSGLLKWTEWQIRGEQSKQHSEGLGKLLHLFAVRLSSVIWDYSLLNIYALCLHLLETRRSWKPSLSLCLVSLV